LLLAACRPGTSGTGPAAVLNSPLEDTTGTPTDDARIAHKDTLAIE
jgi:hypothetical protein